MIGRLARTILGILMLFSASGCINLYERCLGTSLKIHSTYQATDMSFAWASVIMFPQLLGPNGNLDTLYPENFFTIPLGCFCFVDVACEAVVDTVLWPIDKTIASSREDIK